MGTKLADVLKQTTVTIKPGDMLVSLTAPQGYVPTIKGTKMVHKGQYLFKVVGVGTPDGQGKYAKLNIVPMVKSSDNKTFVDDVKNPIVIQEPTKVTYVTGRNDPKYKDVYRGNCYKVNSGITAGQEHRAALLAFIEFSNSELSLGVNSFEIGGEEYIAGP